MKLNGWLLFESATNHLAAAYRIRGFCQTRQQWYENGEKKEAKAMLLLCSNRIRRVRIHRIRLLMWMERGEGVWSGNEKTSKANDKVMG